MKFDPKELLPFFPDAKVLLEREGDLSYCDPSIDKVCGFISMQESRVLHSAVAGHPGNWLELGSHVGWSAAVIDHALQPSDWKLTIVDPAYATNFPVRNRMISNLKRAGAFDRTTICADTSSQFFEENEQRFDGIFIDGHHSHPHPIIDSIWAIHFLKPDGVIVFHDYSLSSVRHAVEYVKSQGFNCKIDGTQDSMCICMRI